MYISIKNSALSLVVSDGDYFRNLIATISPMENYYVEASFENTTVKPMATVSQIEIQEGAEVRDLNVVDGGDVFITGEAQITNVYMKLGRIFVQTKDLLNVLTNANLHFEEGLIIVGCCDQLPANNHWYKYTTSLNSDPVTFISEIMKHETI